MSLIYDAVTELSNILTINDFKVWRLLSCYCEPPINNVIIPIDTNININCQYNSGD